MADQKLTELTALPNALVDTDVIYVVRGGVDYQANVSDLGLVADLALRSNGTGLLTGGVLSTGAGATQYSISDGTGIITNQAGAVTEVSWSGKSNITPTNIASALLTWVAIDSGGNVVEQTTPFSASQCRSLICLGVVVHVDKVNVDNVNNEQMVAYQPINTAHDIADALGFVNMDGNVFSANGANLSINKSAGTMFKVGSNYNVDAANPHNRTLAQLTAATFQYRFSDGSNGTTGTTIDPDNLDNGAGGLTALSNNQYSVQRIYSFVSNNVKIQRGRASYSTMAAAIDGIASEAYTTEQSIADNGLLRAWLVVKKGTTDLSNTALAKFIPAPKFGEGSAGGTTVPAGDSASIILSIKKATAGTLSVGSVVRATGISGDDILCELADADAAGGTPALGIVRETATDSAIGKLVFSGILSGQDTSSFSVGDALYVSTTAGALTATRPTASGSQVQAVGRVLSVDATAGVIQVVGAGRVNDIPNFTATDKFWYGDGTGAAVEGTVTSFGRSLIDDADAAAARTTLGIAAGIGDFLATPSSANLAAAVTDGTGTGSLVLATSPTLVTPVLGTPTSGTLTNCTGLPASGLASGTIPAGATVTLGENAALALDETGSADGKFSGIVDTGTAGENLVFGYCVYRKPADSKWYSTNAAALATSGNVRVAMCVANATVNTATTVLTFGKIRADAQFPTMSVDAPVYVANTAAAISSTAPTGTNAVVRVLGWAQTADELFFQPSADWIVLS